MAIVPCGQRLRIVLSPKLVRTLPPRYTYSGGYDLRCESYGYGALTAPVTGSLSTDLVESTCWRRIA